MSCGAGGGPAQVPPPGEDVAHSGSPRVPTCSQHGDLRHVLAERVRDLVEPLRDDRTRLDRARQDGTVLGVEGLGLDTEAHLERTEQPHERVRVGPGGGGDGDPGLAGLADLADELDPQARRAPGLVLVRGDVRDVLAPVGREGVVVEPLRDDRARLDRAREVGTERGVEPRVPDAEARLERPERRHELGRLDPLDGRDAGAGRTTGVRHSSSRASS